MNEIFIKKEKVLKKDEFYKDDVPLLDRINPLPGNTSYLFLPDNIHEYKVGIISDVHQNSRLLRDVLKIYSEQNVRILFLLGDYSFISDSYEGEYKFQKRTAQFETVMDIVRLWIDENDERQAVIILGNHDIDTKYYEPGMNQILRQKYLFLDGLAKHPRVHTQQDPYFSYDNRNQMFFKIGGLNLGNRTFSLSHSINPKFVNMIYQGYSNDLTIKEKQFENIKNELGEVYASALDPLFVKGGNLWTKYIQGEKNMEIIHEIRDNIIYSLNSDNLINLLTTFDNKYSEEALFYSKNFMADPKQIGKLYNRYLYQHDFHHEIGMDFFNGLRKINNTIGNIPQIMYNLTGHFHVDLGINKTAESVGTFILGGSGMQPNKILSDKFTSYIINITHEYDTIYKVYSKHNPFDNNNDLDCDLSYNLGKF